MSPLLSNGFFFAWKSGFNTPWRFWSPSLPSHFGTPTVFPLVSNFLNALLLISECLYRLVRKFIIAQNILVFRMCFLWHYIPLASSSFILASKVNLKVVHHSLSKPKAVYSIFGKGVGKAQLAINKSHFSYKSAVMHPSLVLIECCVREWALMWRVQAMVLSAWAIFLGWSFNRKFIYWVIFTTVPLFSLHCLTSCFGKVQPSYTQHLAPMH